MKYIDLNGLECQLSFEEGTFSLPSKHVLVIAKFCGKWLLTKHNQRGLEFPGGNKELGESLQEAAIREVYEETGAIVSNLQWFAQYQVNSEKPFCKTVFIAEIERIEKIRKMETDGPILMDMLDIDERFSFLMKDQGMKEIMKKVEQLGKWND